MDAWLRRHLWRKLASRYAGTHRFACNALTQPAAHFGWDFASRRYNYPTETCVLAHMYRLYSSYVGGTTYAELNNQTNYVVGANNGAYGLYSADCTGSYKYICETPRSLHSCPQSPPPLAYPPQPPTLCEYANNAELVSCFEDCPGVSRRCNA